MPQVEDFFSPREDIRDRSVRRPAGDSGELVGAAMPGNALHPLRRRRDLRWLQGSLTIAILIILGRLVELQVIVGSSFRVEAERNRVRLERLQAPRGLILDLAGQPLVENTPNFTVLITPSDLPDDPHDRDLALAQVSQLVGKSRQEIDEVLAPEGESTEPVVIAEFLAYDQAIAATVTLQEKPWVTVVPRITRAYHDAEAVAPIVGYLSKVGPEDLEQGNAYGRLDLIGRSGLERIYEAELRGQAGQRRVERNSSNEGRRVIAEQAPVPGTDLILGVDRGLQQTLAIALAKTMTANRATGGAAIAIDPRNGEVRALVSLPSYDPNDFLNGLTPAQFELLNDDPNHPFLNRAISGEYPSGSTIKPVFASAALDTGIITPSTTISSTGGIRVGQWFFPDWNAGGHGATNLAKAIADSVNTFFYYIGGGFDDFVGLGVRGLTEAASRFGLGTQLGIDLPGESTGFLPSPEWKEVQKGESWYIGDTYHLAIGQGDLLVTPLQIAQATAAIANGGTLYVPHLVSALRRDGQVVPVAPIVINPRVALPASLAAVRAAMREGVISGSSRGLASLPVTASGKTGTAQVAGTERTHAWFTSFAPSENPELVITVLVELDGEGHAAALPVARAGYEQAFATSRPAP